MLFGAQNVVYLGDNEFIYPARENIIERGKATYFFKSSVFSKEWFNLIK